MSEIIIEKINLRGPERNEIEAFLKGFGLVLDKDVEYTAAAKADDEIVGTCSYAGKVLKCFGVRENLQGEGIAAKLITHVTNVLFDRGIFETFIFTKSKNKGIFSGIGYREVYSTGGVTLLEGGMSNINRYIEGMLKRSGLGKDKKASLVMNCNPFTIGHRYLIEKASEENDEVLVFIVEEERSLFPFEVRLELVRKGTEHLKNVHVIPGGNYIISSSTFPSYFLRHEDERLAEYTRLDAGIFGKYIAPVFNINRRYVGTEPYCPVTSRYNQALMEILPQYAVEVKLIERITENGLAVSASRVRDLIKSDNWEEIKKIVPISTYDFLRADEASTIIKKIKSSSSVH
jgi:[citrate (pro-3S)-lyase] ligase